eukprot:TRINITY_DN4707_c0_g1_i6.p1 TRINITY_DN4707_c0_g1~~TRINITY_DN4707_c0_g1_i6.p1  ORF type:complete len:267 (-),score=74.69 TRINITY_DN4707_c0_g1_i6:2039-2839(-)
MQKSTKKESHIVNNVGLGACLKEFALHGSHPRDGADWLRTLTVTTAEPIAVADVNDDLNRERSFYHQALECVTIGRARLKSMNVPFIRPEDYFAEMLKSDEHMTQVRAKLLSEKKRVEEAVSRRNIREQKKFGKKVQKAKQVEKEKKKKEEADVLKKWKQEVKANPKVELDKFFKDTAKKSLKRKHEETKPTQTKREYKNSKFGSGGRKRGKKTNDAESAANFDDYSAKKNKALPKGFQKRGAKGGHGKGKGARPGKNRRMKSMRK